MKFMDTDVMTVRTEGTEESAQPGDDLLNHPLLTVIGLLFESATGAQAMLEGTMPALDQITGQLFEPLLRLSRSEGGRLRMTDLAAQCRYSPSAVTRVSDRLERLGYASRQACPTDRRVVHLAITDAGRALVTASMPEHVRVIDESILAGLTDAERTQLEGLLRRIRDSVHPCAAAVTPLDAGHELPAAAL